MRRNMVVAFIILLIALLATSIAWANGRGGGSHGGGGWHGGGGGHGGHGHVHSGVVISGGFLYYPYPYYWGAPYYPYPYYYSYGYPAYSYSSPPAYVEQYPDPGTGSGQPGMGQGSAPSPSQPYYWYYCPDSQAYYPYAQTCQSAWQQVPAQPPNTSR